MQSHFHEANRLSWNAATRAHNSHKGDQAAFLREGGSTLFPEEKELLGDLTGLEVLHLQCNSGQDTLGLVQLGGAVTGVDISDEAIRFATALSADSGLPANFHRMDVYDYFTAAAEAGVQYDVIFASYGTICWLSDLEAWGRGIHTLMRPGGRFVFVEFHPFSMIFDEQWRFHYDYFPNGAVDSPGVSDYVALSGNGLALGEHQSGIEDFVNPHPAHEFAWGVGDVITSLTQAGLAILRLDEYPYANGCALFEGMRDSGGRRMVPPEGMPSIPLMYRVLATKPRA
jgi:SAM-dependent methyltransferase